MKLATLATAAGIYLPLTYGATLPVPYDNRLPEGQLSWTGIVTKGGQNVTLNGTVDSIYAEIEKLNPNFDSEIGEENEHEQPAIKQKRDERWDELKSKVVKTGSDIRKQFANPPRPKGNPVDPINWDSIDCGRKDFSVENVSVKGAMDVANKLRRMGGMCTVKDEFYGCSSVGCSSKASLLVCLKNGQSRLQIPCSHIADNAEGLVEKCNTWSTKLLSKSEYEVGGRISSFDGSWSVTFVSGWC